MNSKLNNLKIENIIWIVFIILSLLSIYGNYLEKKYFETNNYKYDIDANKIFEITLIVTLIIYLYFLYRNYNIFLEEKNKEAYSYKIIGNVLLVIGIIFLLYFQDNKNADLGSPII